jgi:triacylglycerol lipase
VLEALSPQRRRLVLVVGALVLVLVVVITAVGALRNVAAGESVPQDQPGPVLLVPGYGGEVAALTPLVSVLESAGRKAIVVPAIAAGTGDLRAQAEQLATVAARERDAAGAPSVDVIGYSAGGVVARLWVRDFGGAAVARRVVSLGSPQHGTTQAALGRDLAGGCPVACEQLVPDSDLLRALNAGDETPDGPAWISLWSTLDVVVTPPDSAVLEGALNVAIQDVCPNSRANHGDLPGDPVVAATLASVLGPGPPLPLQDVAC